MYDINYFLDRASTSTQSQFELDFADVIEVFDTNETTLTTECGRTLVITWQDNSFKSYHVIYETAQMEKIVDRKVILNVIQQLKDIEVDGETMQYIIEKVGMKEQMFRQLVLSSKGGPLEELLSEWEEIYGEMLEF